MSHPDQLTVIAAVLDVRNLILYKEDGTTYLIPQGDPRVQRIIDQCQKELGPFGAKAVVNIGEANHYADFEEKTGGLVKLFRVAKSKVAEFFGKTEAKPMEPITLGIIPTAKDVPAMTAVVKRRDPVDPVTGEKTTHLAAAVTEIMANAVPATSKDFVEPKAHESAEDTMIAVVDGKVIPDVAALKPQMAAAVLRPNATTKGMEAFLSRLAKVIDKRRHSVEDLMKFLQKGDLPIADDGSIVIYKILKRKAQGATTFYDMHSGNVPQKVGSFVHMDEAMVDPNRGQDCSHGLHVARRGYLGNFNGDVCVLAKVAPEDVIAVPQYDANKMRVCGYHILEVLSADTFSRLKSNQAMTNNEADKALLGRVLAGDHIGIQEYVKITGPKGGGIVITAAKNQDLPVKVTSGIAQKAEERKVEALPENGCVAPDVDVKAVAAAVTAQKEEQKFQAPPAGMHTTEGDCGMPATPPPMPSTKKVKPVKKLSLKEQALAMYKGVIESSVLADKQVAAAALVLFKKEKKKSWTELGFTDDIVTILTDIAKPALPQKGAIFTNEATIAKAEKKAAKVRKPRKDMGTSVSIQRDKETGELTMKAPPVPKAPRVVPVKGETLADKAKQLMHNVTDGNKQSAKDLLNLKKTSKKSWDYLGVTDTQLSLIKELAK